MINKFLVSVIDPRRTIRGKFVSRTFYSLAVLMLVAIASSVSAERLPQQFVGDCIPVEDAEMQNWVIVETIPNVETRAIVEDETMLVKGTIENWINVVSGEWIISFRALGYTCDVFYGKGSMT